MKYFLMSLFAAVLLVGISTTPASAQGMRMSPEERVKQLKDSLSLDDKQTDAITAIFKEMGAKRQAMMDSIDDRDARREAMTGLMKTTDEKIESVLTPEQKDKYEVMKKERESRFRQRSN